VEKASEMLKCKCGKLRVIIMDCEMPIKDGYEATLEITQMMNDGIIREIPIVACTAFTGDSQRNKCLECGMKGFMNKPIMIDELKKTLQDCGMIL